MHTDAELLNYIYQNSQMGITTLQQIIEIVEDSKLKTYLQSQLKEYKDINKESMQLLNENGYEEKDISAISKVMAYMSINMQTLTDKTPSHIADMLIQGSTMGVTEATKNLKNYSEANVTIQALNKKLLKTEENNIEELKCFL